ncbi:MAG: hopanoid biosynthesis associated radical SAM protein HpnJ [Nitrospiraceae bacterium]|nr:hopanoid biosynthesis associated radical SAM protein HpnJ [Nitrospiraceae bacterium]
MRVLFLNPPSFMGFDGGAGARYQARREIRSFWYPAWLAYAAGLVKESLLVDAPPADMGIEEVVRAGKGFHMAVIHTSTPTIRNDCAVAQKFKEAYPGILVGFVGPHAMTLPLETLQSSDSIDFVCTGEFDYTIAEIAEGRDFREVSGVAYLQDGKLVRTPDRPLITDLDALPFVTDIYARDLKIENYYDGYLDHPYMAIYTARGCLARCAFCLWPQTIGGRAYRTRSPENVYAEMSRAKSLFPQVKEYYFDDDTFTGNPSRAAGLAKLIGPLGLKWSATARANVSYETLKVLKENGLRLLVVGFESGNQRILDNIKKGITVEGAKKFVRACKELGILIHACFIMGLPGETAGTIEETIRFAKWIDPYSIQVSLPAPYPGTELYRQAVKEGWLETAREELDRGQDKPEGQKELVKGGIQTAVLSYPHLPKEEIFEAVERFYRRFYFRPRPVLRILKEMLSDREVFKRRAREGREFLSFMAKRKEAAR